MDIRNIVQYMLALGLPALTLLGFGVWAIRDTRAPVHAVGILLIALGVALGLPILVSLAFVIP